MGRPRRREERGGLRRTAQASAGGCGRLRARLRRDVLRRNAAFFASVVHECVIGDVCRFWLFRSCMYQNAEAELRSTVNVSVRHACDVRCSRGVPRVLLEIV